MLTVVTENQSACGEGVERRVDQPLEHGRDERERRRGHHDQAHGLAQRQSGQPRGQPLFEPRTHRSEVRRAHPMPYVVGSSACSAYLLIRWAVLAAAFAITAWLLDGVDVSGGFWGYLWVSALFGIVNVLIGTILRILTLPLMLLTLGLFSILVNALLLQIIDAISDNFTIDEFWWTAIWAAIILSIVSVILDMVVRSALASKAT